MTRFIHVLRHEVYQQLRMIAVSAGAVAGTILLFGMLSWVGGLEVINLWPLYGPVMTLLGVLFTSRVFSELRTPGMRIEYLLRPATIWEKVGAKLIVSTIVVWLAATLAFLIATFLGVIVYLILGGGTSVGQVIAEALSGGRWIIIAGETFVDYLPVHGIFFFGAVYFRRNAVAKTLLSAVVWMASYVFLAVIFARITFHRYFTGEVPHSGARRLGEFEGPLMFDDLDGYLWQEIAPWYLQNPEALQTIAAVAVVLIFWSLTLLRLRETEA